MNPLEAAELLEKVANGDMTAAEALVLWPGAEKESRELDVAWHDLSHFCTDDDIRTKDTKYDQYQRDLLRKHASDLRGK